MATTRITWYGAVIEFSHSEITQIANHIGTAGATAGTAAAALTAMGITGVAAIVTAAAAAVLQLGSSALNGCNSQQNGIYLHVLWVGVPWCRTR